MTEIHLDKYYQEKCPELYELFLAVYGQKIVYLYLWYLKHLRRYGQTKLYVLNIDGKIINTIVFDLVDKKAREGQTTVNGIDFPTVSEAWQYYINEVFGNLL